LVFFLFWCSVDTIDLSMRGDLVMFFYCFVGRLFSICQSGQSPVIISVGQRPTFRNYSGLLSPERAISFYSFRCFTILLITENASS
jgi:hypothetical protein